MLKLSSTLHITRDTKSHYYRSYDDPMEIGGYGLGIGQKISGPTLPPCSYLIAVSVKTHYYRRDRKGSGPEEKAMGATFTTETVTIPVEGKEQTSGYSPYPKKGPKRPASL